MNTYILTYTPFPYGGGASVNRIINYAKSISNNDVFCKVLSYRHTEKVEKPKNSQVKGVFEGIKFEYTSGNIIRSRYRLIRYLQDYLDKKKLCLFIKKNISPGDIIILYLLEDTNFVSKVINCIHRVGARAVLELCEYPFLAYEGHEGELRRCKYGELVLSKIDGCICISKQLKEYIKPYIKEQCQIIHVPILVDLSKFDVKCNTQQPPYPYIFHSGSLYERKDGVAGVLIALAKANKNLSVPLHFVSTGNLDGSPDSKKLLEVIDEYRLHDKVHFLGYVSSEELQDKLNKATLVVVNKNDTLQNRYCFATKLGEYTAASKPIIMTEIGEATNWFKHGESTYFVKVGDLTALSNAICLLMNDDKLRSKISHGGNKLCKESFLYQNYSKDFMDMFRKINNING